MSTQEQSMSDVVPQMTESVSEESGTIPSETTDTDSNQTTTTTTSEELILLPLITPFQLNPVAPAAGKKVKVDQGFKIKLRADRESLHQLFKSLGYGTGKHHWKPERWIQEVTNFSEDPHFRGLKFTCFEIAAMVLMLYPSFGRTMKKEPEPEVFTRLGPTSHCRELKLTIYHSIF